MREEDNDPLRPMTEDERLEKLREEQALAKLAHTSWYLSGDKLISQNIESFGNAEIIKEGLQTKRLEEVLGYKAIPVNPAKLEEDQRLEMAAPLAVPFFRATLGEKLRIKPNEDGLTSGINIMRTEDAISKMANAMWYDKGDYMESSISFVGENAKKCVRILKNHGVENVRLAEAEDDLFRTGEMVLQAPDKKQVQLFMMMFSDAGPSISVRPVVAGNSADAAERGVFEKALDHHGDHRFMRMLNIEDSEKTASRSQSR